SIRERAAEWWTSLGGGQGTKCFGLSGHLARPGLAEVEMGTTLRHLIESIGGGMRSGRTLTGMVLGGPSGIIVPPRELDEPLVPGGRATPGPGAPVALNRPAPVRDALRRRLDVN